jgi:putative membrane protein
MQWWCSTSNIPWDWSWRAYPGVWLFIIVLFVMLRRWNAAGARASGSSSFEPWRSAALGLGTAVLWIALDWPVGTLASGYLASVHMAQFMMIAMIAAPLLLCGITPQAMRLVEGRAGLLRVLSVMTKPVMALVLFNIINAITHTPVVVDTLMPSQLGNMAIDLLWLAGGAIFWWPVVSRVPARPKFVDPLKIGYLIIGLMFSPVNIGVSAFLVYSRFPLFRTYELAPPIPGVSTVFDHQLAGLMMSVGGGMIAMVGMSILFFRWARTSG